MPFPLWHGNSSLVAFSFAFACPQQVPEELSKTRVLPGWRGIKQVTILGNVTVMCGDFLFSQITDKEEEQITATVLHGSLGNPEMEK